MPESATILVVDDEEPVRTLLQRALEGTGCHVVSAAGGRQALDEMSRQEIALVLLDVRMPGMSGIEALGMLRADYPDTAVLMVTAVVDRETMAEAMRLGAYGYITKPFNLDELLKKVREALVSRRREC